MKFQDREVKWTSLELNGLLEDEESHVHFTRTTKHLALHPYHLNNIQRGINQILGSSLNTYDRELKGFMLAFRNPKLLSNLGEILYDSPFIHIDVEADFYLFCPMVGTFLKGIVNKKGLDHIVVLIHKIYTISIPKPDDTEEWPGELVEIGQEVKCCVSRIDNKSKPPYICATLRSNYSQGCRLSLNNIDNVDSAIESMNTSMRIDASANGISEDDVSEKERKKHRKKHKKSHENDTKSVCKVENKSETSDNVKNDTSVTIKSEKKSQYQNMQDSVSSTDEFLNNSEVDNVPKKHKKSKKISISLLSDDTILDEHTELRKAMKRESSIPLDSITEIETKKRKKQAKKSKESDSETVSIKAERKEIICKTESTIPKHIKTEKEEQHSETERKKKKKHVKKSDSETVSIKTEKEEIICMTESTIPKHVKTEKEQYSETERKKKKKHAKKSKESDSETVSIKIEKEEIICMTEGTIPKHIKTEKEEHSETERKKKKKHAKKSKESDPENVSIKTENEEIICQTEGIISRHIKSEKQYISNTDLSSSNLEDNVSKKHKKNKKSYMKMSDSESGGC